MSLDNLKDRIEQRRMRNEFAHGTLPHELYGHIKITQVAVVILATHLKCSGELKRALEHYTEDVLEGGLTAFVGPNSREKVVTKDDLPELFEGMVSACDHIVGLIDFQEKFENEALFG